jgi:1-acyl-sn-glycerol-3-phosphate acyltransferase
LMLLRQMGPCLVVANHTSWLDGLILFSLIPDVRILVAARYQNVPLVRHPMRWLESIVVDRRSRESVMRSVQEMSSALQRATPVAVFPEGTRGTPGHLRPFGDISFRVALDVGAVVQPVLLHLDEPFLGPGAENFLTARKATLKIRVLERVSPVPGEGGKDLAFRVRAAMKKALGDLEIGTPQNGEMDG